MHVTRGLRQAAFLLVGAAVAAASAAGIWLAAQGGEFQRALALALVIVAGLLAVTGGPLVARTESSGIRALLGQALDQQEMPTGVLTGFGIFLLVSLPLFVIGRFLTGSG